MRIDSVRLSYRAFRQAEILGLRDFNIFIGPNNAGKSSIFEALAKIAEAFEVAREFGRTGWAVFENFTQVI